MDDKKHIDQFYKENLKDLEIKPNDKVWVGIQEKMNRVERKPIPLWIRLSGIAASLLLVFIIGNLVINSSDSIPETTVDSENINPVIEGTSNQIESSQNPTSTKEVQSTVQKANQTADVHNQANNANSQTGQKNGALTNKKAKSISSQQNGIVSNNIKSTHNLDDVELVNEIVGEKNSSEVAVTDNNKRVKNEELGDKSGIDTNSEVEVNELVEILEEIEDKDEINDSVEKRWAVSTSIAPVYFNTLSDGSSIHSQFNQNEKTGKINMSYGIAVTYNINKKINVRIGVNKLQLGYSTNDIYVYNNLSAVSPSSQMRNVALNKQAQGTSFLSIEEFAFGQIPGVLSPQIVGSIDQELGFIEVPMEIAYQISSKKVGIKAIGGFSALFLNENKVYSVLDGKSTLLGNATNINKTSYSANFGLGLDYKLSQNFNLNFEPMFKYQLNTFENTSGDFKPYFIGFYSGVRFKF
jgi:cytoskeletal protein RodZ